MGSEARRHLQRERPGQRRTLGCPTTMPSPSPVCSFVHVRPKGSVSKGGGGRSLKTHGALEASAHRTPRPQEGSTSTSTSPRRKQRGQEPRPKPSPADPRGVLPSSRPCSGQQSISPDRVGHSALHRGVTASKCTGPAWPPAGPKPGTEAVTGRQRVTPRRRQVFVPTQTV